MPVTICHSLGHNESNQKTSNKLFINPQITICLSKKLWKVNTNKFYVLTKSILIKLVNSIILKNTISRFPTCLHLKNQIDTCISTSTWFQDANSAPSHYLNQCWVLSIGPLRRNFSEILIKIQNFHSPKCIWKYLLRNGVIFIQGEMS